MTEATVFDATPCTLGEGPFWAEGRLYWFDILENRLHASDGDKTLDWQLKESHSAGGILESGLLLIFSESGLWRFDPVSGRRILIISVEANIASNRCNDARADRQGGFWCSTMSKDKRAAEGALYRFFRGELRRLRTGLTIPNGLCFTPDGRRGYFADSAEGCLYTWALDADGWPEDEPEPFFRPEAGTLDGAVIDRDHAIWVALHGAGRVVRLLPDGTLDAEIEVPVSRVTCPAFGGDLCTLYLTTSREDMDPAELKAEPQSGFTFAARVEVPGLPEPRIAGG